MLHICANLKSPFGSYRSLKSNRNVPFHVGMWDKSFSLDWIGVEDPWIGASVDLVALQSIVCQVLRVPATQCGPPVAINEEHASYARVYSFQLPTRTVVARVVAPVKPLFKTESEVAAMDFVRSRTSLPVPQVFAYCSEANNPVGAEWLIMEHMSGVEMGVAWDDLQLPQKRRLALDLIDLYDQFSLLKAEGCGGIYQSVKSTSDSSRVNLKHPRSPRWAPLSPESLRMLRTHCNHSLDNGYALGPIHDIALLKYRLVVPSPSQTLPTFTTDEYVKLIAFNGNPSTRSHDDLPTREKCVQLFQSIQNLYPNSMVFGPSADASNFRFSHGDLHDGNILIDPQSGAITGIIDWEAAAFRPLWAEVCGVGWFEEDHHRFMIGAQDPENFEEETDPADVELRAFFRTELHKRNPTLFTCFLGGVELRAVLHAAVDAPRPEGETNIFLGRYQRQGCWNEDRRGPFPWVMDAWLHKRLALDAIDMKRIDALKRAADISTAR
ncbi:hypothetical protein M413DRAFT_31995 [Hebeloma cylindrosporum]|uniref:Aminoglycoside phosphotransferase domain-containing protein n=1 Tax=Hebeloma cylindrosporum TaxID=76867 RepID=A0A0C3BVM2_HEBCY|nr:hypothetical protein M413DRAFT_31995 [Hebeloma cylindrosporum h7]